MKLSKDKQISIIFIVLSILILVLTQKVRVLPNLAEPGPRLFPQVAAGGMLVCAIGMFFDKGSENENTKPYLTKEGWKRFFIVFVVISLYVASLWLVGFKIATPFAMLAFVAVLSDGKKVSKILSIIIALAATALLYLAFTTAFAIPLPAGLLFR